MPADLLSSRDSEYQEVHSHYDRSGIGPNWQARGKPLHPGRCNFLPSRAYPKASPNPKCFLSDKGKEHAGFVLQPALLRPCPAFGSATKYYRSQLSAAGLSVLKRHLYTSPKYLYEVRKIEFLQGRGIQRLLYRAGSHPRSRYLLQGSLQRKGHPFPETRQGTNEETEKSLLVNRLVNAFSPLCGFGL